MNSLATCYMLLATIPSGALVDTGGRGRENTSGKWRMKSFLVKCFLLVILAGLGLSGCERLAWRKANQERTLKSYQEFLARYPNGKYAPGARRMIESYYRSAAMRDQTLAAYRDYLTRYPEGDFAGMARQQVLKILKRDVENIPLQQIGQARVTIVTGMGKFSIRLLPDQAPRSSRNLLVLAFADFFAGQRINLVQKDALVKMGDPRGNGLGGPGYMIPAEHNQLQHVRGAVSMWHLALDPNTAGSQFIICLKDLPNLDGKFTVFGQVADGMTVLEAISRAETEKAEDNSARPPLSPIEIVQVEVAGLKPPE